MKLLNNNCGYVEARNVEIYRRWLIAVKIEKRETNNKSWIRRGRWNVIN